ncbi:Dynein light chain roadblock-type 2 [Galemys pyrenaicus]|uniref:Dynein light chain roadblock-type 2 n=1 Tax=Galemys pyrenaicus TaxID=202257 RepID=A0A8J5ZRY6_GALPY|nr:Dynein light chain roadblock-type 2 [Galemys pyrenaicus]
MEHRLCRPIMVIATGECCLELVTMTANTDAIWMKQPATCGYAEVEETLKRIQSHKGVIGTMVVNAEGIPIRTTLDNSTTVQYAGLLHQLTMKTKSTVRDIDPQNDLTFLRIRSKKHEIMVAPGNPAFHFKCEASSSTG